MALPTLLDAKLHLRVDTSDEDALIQVLLTAAIGYFELHARRILSSQTLTQKQDLLSNPIYLKQGPVTGVTSVTVRTLTTTDTISSSDYITQTGQTETNPQIYFKDGITTPSPDGYPGAVTVTYTAATTTIPPSVNIAVLLLVGHWYENRQAVGPTGGGTVPFAFEAIANKFIWGAYS